MSLRSRFGNRNLERKLIHAIRVMAPTLLALSFAGVAKCDPSSLREIQRNGDHHHVLKQSHPHRIHRR